MCIRDSSYADSSTGGFGLTHVAGPGCHIAGDVPILHTVGPMGSNPVASTEPFSHSDEQASPGYYGDTLAPGTASAIQSQLTVTTRTGIGEFNFPPTQAANLLFKVTEGNSADTRKTGGVDIVGDHEVTGSKTQPNFCGAPGTYTVYFAAIFDRPFQSSGTWTGSTVTPGSTAATGSNAGSWVTFDTTTQSRRVRMKIAISYVSVAGAQDNLRAEDPGWSFSAVRNKAHNQWNSLLSRIGVGGGTASEQVQFYTALYHALSAPNVFSDADGTYLGFDNKLHQLAGGQRAQYTNFSGWDIYRSEVQLLAMVDPRSTSDMVQSLLNDQAQGGWLPKWPFSNNYTNQMGGDSADPIIADAYAFGARDFDVHAALAAMVKGATALPTQSQFGQGWYIERSDLSAYEELGYVPTTSVQPYGASVTLEYALDDFSIAQLAQALGQTSTYETFLDRSQNWTNLFNVNTGYIQPRDENGNFPTGDPLASNAGFQEGNAAQYSWMVPQNLHGLFSAMGGNTAVVNRLDAFFTQFNADYSDPYENASNEATFGVPWAYDYAGAPYKTQAVVHQLLGSVYSDTPSGLPGNDDLGAMSSWYVWGALGMFPETPGAPVLALGSPLFSTITFHLAHRTVTISAPGASPTSYVQSLRVNGHPWGKAWLPASVIIGQEGSPRATRTSLSFSLGSAPNTSWGATEADEPPSYPSGPLQFPPG